MRKSDFVSIGSEIKTNTKLTARDDFDNLYVNEDDDPKFFGFGIEDEGSEEEKPKKKDKNKKDKNKKDKKAKAGSNRVTAPTSTEPTSKELFTNRAGSNRVTAPTSTEPTSKELFNKAGRQRNPMTLDPSGGDGSRPAATRNPMFTDPSAEKTKPNTPRITPSFVNPNNADAPTKPVTLDPSHRIGGTPSGSKLKAAIDSSKLTGKRLMKISGSVISNTILKPLAVIGGSKWLGPVLLTGQGAKFAADWYAYNTGAARVQQLGDYTAPCLDTNYDPYDDPFIDIYGDDAGTTYNLDYYGKGFKDILNSYDVEAFTPRMSNLIYGVLPTLLTSVATSMVIFRAIAMIAGTAGAATGPGIIIGAIAGIASIGVGWIITRIINKLLKSIDKWGPGAADVVAQFAMEQLTTSSNLQTLCGTNLSEAAQDDEYQDRDEEPISGGGVDTFAIMELAATIKEVFKEIDQELQAEGDQEKLAEWRRTLKQAKEMAKEQIKG